ncbi:MAG: aldo/keto reductase [Chitinophagales bacterium]|nr:aldo/keto reductase [Chitinophagales bacterium]
MQRIKLSANGPEFSRIVFGVMKWGDWGHQLNTQQMLSLMQESIEYGVTTFDHADIYGGYTTEEAFGNALKLNPGLRGQMELISKCGIKIKASNRPEHRLTSYDISREHILKSVERSLKNLHTDYLDLLLIHRPSPLMHPDEIAATFSELKQAGKVRFFGVSNFTPSQFEMVNSRFPLVTNQIEASLLQSSSLLDGTLDQCIQLDIKPMAWSPLGGGRIFTDKEDEQIQRVNAAIDRIIKRYSNDIRPDQLLLAWLMKHPSKVLPVVGTARIERLKAAADAVAIELEQEEWFELWEAAMGHEVP